MQRRRAVSVAEADELGGFFDEGSNGLGVALADRIENLLRPSGGR